MQAAKPSGELFSASSAIMNYSVVNYSRQGKLRRLWRLAVATHPPIAGHHSSELAVGFMVQVPLRGTRSSYSICLHLWVRGYGHANIVQRVKTCYKIKIDSRDLDGCFYGVLLCKRHPSLTIAPLLHSNSATIAAKNGSFVSLISWRFARIPHNMLCISILTPNAQNSRISHQRFCCALNEEY